MGFVVNSGAALTPPQLHAVRYVIARVRSEVAAALVQTSLFGSRARGDARPDSDVDLLLVFRHLPPDREPYATQAERIAEEEARRTGIPVTVWAVSLTDLALGNRTPMLVDALADAIPLWVHREPLPSVSFTPRDAAGCVHALLRRLAEGSEEFALHLRRADEPSAAKRLRDDLVRVCTATLLLDGMTRPRRAEAVRTFIAREDPDPLAREILEWAERSFGASGTEEDAPVIPPPHRWAEGARVLEAIRRKVVDRLAELRTGIDSPPGSRISDDSGEWSLRSLTGADRP